MADYDGIISPSPEWVDIPSLSTSAIALGGAAGAGAMNAQAVAFAKRTNYLINYSVQISPATGNAGIGTSSPLGRLQIGDLSANANNKIVFGKAQAATETNLPAIGQRSTGTGNDLVLAATSAAGSVKVYAGASTNSGEIGTGSNTEKLRVESSGNVTANGAQARFVVSPTTGTNNALTQFVNTAGNAYVGLDGSTGSLGGSSYSLNLWHNGNYPINFATNNILRGAFGNDGIFNKIVSSSTGTETVGIRFTNGTQNLGSIRSYNQTGYNQHLRFYTSNAGTETLAMAIDQSGYVGIGTAAPTAQLHIAGSSSRLQNAAATDTAFSVVNSVGSMVIGTDASTSYLLSGSSRPLTFYTNGAEQARITSSGMLIGTSTYTLNAAGRGLIELNGSVDSVFGFKIAGSNRAYIQANANNDLIIANQTATGSAAIYTNGVARFTVNSSGNIGINQTSPDATLSVDGTIRVGVGSPTTSFKGLILASTLTDTFTTDTDKVVHHYGITCKSFSDAPGAPVVTVSGYNGIRNFTNGAERMRINSVGDQINYGTGALKVHEGTTAQRPSTPSEGMIRKNSTLGVIEGYSGGGYVSLEAGRLIAITDYTGTPSTDLSFTLNTKTQYIFVEMIGGGGAGGAIPGGTYTAGYASVAGYGATGTYCSFYIPSSILQRTYYYRTGIAGTTGGSLAGSTILAETLGALVSGSGRIECSGGANGHAGATAAVPPVAPAPSVYEGRTIPRTGNFSSVNLVTNGSISNNIGYKSLILGATAGLIILNPDNNTNGSSRLKVATPSFGQFGAGGQGAYKLEGIYSDVAYNGIQGMIRVYEYS